jgi:hypothetical protein
MKITDDDCFASDNGLLIACSDWEKTAGDILKNQEIAEKYKLMMTPTAKDMEKALQIVERLKKYLNNIDADILDKEKVHLCDEYSCEDNVREAIQKILGEENDTN